MRRKSLLLAAYAAFIGFCVLSFVFGPSGLLAHSRIEERRLAMEFRLAALRQEGEILASRLADLGGEKEIIAAEAARLGYSGRGEGRVFVDKLDHTLEERKRIDYLPQPKMPDAMGKELAFGALAIGFLVFVISQSLMRRRGDSARYG